MFKIGDIVKFTHMHDTDLGTSYEKAMKSCLNKIGKVINVYDYGCNPSSEVMFENKTTWVILNECLEKGHLEWIADED